MNTESFLGRTNPVRDAILHRLPALGAALLLAALVAAPAARAQAAPTLTSVTPSNGATGVAITSTIVFVFDQAMDVEVEVIPSFPPFLVGNLEFGPAGAVALVTGVWQDDLRTFTCEASTDLPANTTITWTLNPAGTLFPFTSSSGTPVATVSGSFTTGAGSGGETGPKLVSSAPADGAATVPVTTSVVFVFDEAMQKNTSLGGLPPAVPGGVFWGGSGVTATKFTYSWSEDGKTLTCDYAGDLPGDTQITWILNPAGAMSQFQLQNEAGEPVAPGLFSGDFTTGQGTGDGCNPDGVPETWGGYSLSKSGTYEQTSAADPAPTAEDPFVFGVYVASPQAGPAATNGFVTLPNATRKDLEAVPFGGLLFYSDLPATEAALDSAYPAGTYTLRFTQTGESERVVPMTMPAGNPPVPKITNYPEAQAVNAAQDFTLGWNAFTGAGANEYLSLSISDHTGGFFFQAPDPCVPRELPVTATSIVIPANTLTSNKTYSATLSFSRWFYTSTNAVPDMAGIGVVSRSTEFTIKTGAGGGTGDPARFTAYRLLPNGNPEMNLTGTATRSYTIQRTGSLGAPNWTNLGPVTMDATGQAVFEDTQAGKTLPLFYRAVAD